MAHSERDILRSELRWGGVVAAAVLLLMGLTLYATMALHRNPPSNLEHIDPATLYQKGEFTAGNLGTRVAPDGSVTVRVVATQYEFEPRCVEVPLKRPVTLRFTSPDVIHGILVAGTNVNTMIVPGYVSQVHATFTRAGRFLMPCQEFCGLGHSAMLAHVEVVPAAQFHPDAQGIVRCG